MPTFYIIDGNSLIYRAFFAVPAFATTKGLPTNAVFGFTKMLLKIIKDKKPDHLAVVFDAKGPTFRSQLFEQYKAHRPKMPDQLVVQRPYIREMVEAFRIPILEIEGIEADDVIGTFIARFKNDFCITMVTGDKDLMQFVEDGKVWLYDSMKDIAYQRQEVFAKMCVYPEQIVDLLSLMGDSADNIPGVKGVGPKTAVKLLEQYSSLKGVYDHLDTIEGSLHTKLKTEQEMAFLSYKLATIKTDVEFDIHPDQLKMSSPDLEKLNTLLDQLEFKSLKKEITGMSSFEPEVYAPPAKVYEKRYITVTDQSMFDHIVQEIRKKGECAIDTETTSLDTFSAALAGISISWEQNIGYYIPVGHVGYEHNLDKAYVLKQIFALLDDDTITKIGHNIKYDLAIFESQHRKMKQGIPDTSPEQQMKLI